MPTLTKPLTRRMPRLLTRERPYLLSDNEYHDGISLDFVRNRFYVKPVGRPAQVAPFTSLFTFTRAAPDATYRGADGLIKLATTNIPRVEYDTSGNCLGLLIEGSGTNLLLHSRDHTNAAWVKTTMTAAKDEIGVDGVTNSASSLLATAINALSLQTVVIAASSRVLSFDIKRLIGSGTIELTQDGATFTNVTSQINSTTYTRVLLIASQLNPILGIRLGTSGDKIAVDFGQFENALITSRIPTTTATVTRALDSASRTDTENILNDATQGTTLAEINIPYSTLVPSYVLAKDDASDDTAMALQAGANLVVSIFDPTTGVSKATGISTPLKFKAATAFSPGEKAVTALGQTPATGAYDGNLYNGTLIRLGRRLSATDMLFGHIKRLDYWPERFPNDVLQRMTA